MRFGFELKGFYVFPTWPLTVCGDVRRISFWQPVRGISHAPHGWRELLGLRRKDCECITSSSLCHLTAPCGLLLVQSCVLPEAASVRAVLIPIT